MDEDKCKFCDKPADILLGELRDGEFSQVSFCKCHRKNYVYRRPIQKTFCEITDEIDPLLDILIKKIDEKISVSPQKDTLNISDDEQKCPNCGMKISLYFKTGIEGCPKCYEFFEPYIRIALKKKLDKIDEEEPVLDKIDIKLESLLSAVKEEMGEVKKIIEIPEEIIEESIKEEDIDSLKRKMKEMVKEEKFDEAAKIRDQIKEKEEKPNL